MQTYLNNNSFREKIFRLRINEETYNVNIKSLQQIIISIYFLQDITMVKISCVSINEIDFSEYGRRLIANIENGF